MTENTATETVIAADAENMATVDAPVIDRIGDDEIAALRAEAAARVAATNAPKAEVTNPTPASKTPKGGATINPNSIRQTVIRMLLEGKDTKAIAAVLADRFPGTAAAAKSTIHIAYYRSSLRKEGLLPAAGK